MNLWKIQQPPTYSTELYDLEFDQLKAIYQGYEQQINQLVLNQYQPL